MTALYRSREKISVTLTLIPSASAAVIAGRPAWVAGILMKQVGPVDDLPQLLAWAMVRVGVVRQPRVDLDRDPAVDAVGGVVGRAQHVAGRRTSSVVIVADGVVDVGAAGGELADLLRRRRRRWPVPRRRSSGWWSPRRRAGRRSSSAGCRCAAARRDRSSSQSETPAAARSASRVGHASSSSRSLGAVVRRLDPWSA